MWIRTQDRTKLYNLDNFQGIEYDTTEIHQKHRKGGEPPEKIPTLFLSDGCLEEIGRYATKERCLEVLDEIENAFKESCYSNRAFDVAAQAYRPYLFMCNMVYQMPEK